MLEMEQITKKYDNIAANHGVDFSLKEGEVHAIVGENGAGKTTLMRILFGMEKPTSGKIRIRGKEKVFETPSDAIRSGIGMVHQHFMVFPSLTVTENIVVGHEPARGVWFDRKRAVLMVEELSRTYNMPVEPERKVMDCSLGMQQRVEILKVLYQGADIIVLDEPTAVLAPLEVKELLSAIRSLAQQGKSIILITHKLHEVIEVADRITVLRSGQVTGVLESGETSVEELSRLMVGREIAEVMRNEQKAGKVVLEVKDLLVRGEKGNPLVDKVSFQVRSGEIVGIAGVSGNGQSELIQSISGLRQANEGEVHLLGTDITHAAVRRIRDAGLAHIPEDRYQWGAAKEASVKENGMIGHDKKKGLHRFGIVSNKSLHYMVSRWIELFSIKAGSLEEKVQHLSGGNLQKLIVAREMAHESPLLIAAEPTRGVDIGAMEFIHGQLMKKRDHGEAVLLMSSELSEILKLSDRVLVMYQGKIVGELTDKEATEGKISLLMAGGTHE